MITHHLGRFSLALPETFRLKGSSCFTRQITMSSVDLDTEEPSERTAEGYWAKQMRDVRRLGTSTSTGDFEAIIDDAPLGPKVRAVFYRRAKTSSFGLLAVLLDGQRGTLFSTEWLEFYHDPAKDRALTATMRAKFAEAVAAHRPLPQGARGPIDRQAIYLPFGVVALAPPTGEGPDDDTGGESTSGVFDDREHNVSMFTFDASRPWEPQDDNAPGFLERISKTFMGFAVGITRVHGGKRMVAGLPGEELIFKERGRKGLSFSWVYEPPKGIAWNRYVPKIVIDLQTVTDDDEASFPKWNAILDSLQILPMQDAPGARP